MPKDFNLTYSVIIPAYNEELHILKVLSSLSAQTYAPKEVIIVDDNSKDDTKKTVEEFTYKHKNFRVISSLNAESYHEPGAKIVDAFYRGFSSLKKDWDVIVKLDADIILPENYFEKIISAMRYDSQIGIAGGMLYIWKDDKWTYENITGKNHVRGAIKTYSKKCFDKIGGIKRSIGWDTVDELLAMYYGFKVATFSDLKAKQLRPTASKYKSKQGDKFGKVFYKLRYGFPISLVAMAKAAWVNKNPLLFFNALYGYFTAQKSKTPRLVTAEEGDFIRKYRKDEIIKKLKKR